MDNLTSKFGMLSGKYIYSIYNKYSERITFSTRVETRALNDIVFENISSINMIRRRVAEVTYEHHLGHSEVIHPNDCRLHEYFLASSV